MKLGTDTVKIRTVSVKLGAVMVLRCRTVPVNVTAEGVVTDRWKCGKRRHGNTSMKTAMGGIAMVMVGSRVAIVGRVF